MSTQVDPREMFDNVLDDISELEDRVDDLEAAHERIAELEARVQELDERTDMLRLIEQSDDLDARQRSTAIIQHAIEELRNSRRTKTAYDRDKVDDILHFPEVDRTTLYTDMERCERLVGDDDVCSYTKASESETGDAHVTFDLSHVDDDVDASTLIGGGA